MAETKHTPGPWLVHGNSTLHMQDATIAEVGRHERVVTHERGDGINRHQHAANARLIAAAPDLFAALEDLHADIAGRIEDGAKFNPGTMVALETARRAITKARGGT